MSKTTLIIDGYGFIFRAYHSLPPLTDPDNTPVGAVFGFVSMLLKILAEFKPNHAVVVFDNGKKNFRHEIYKQYKMNRPEVPEDLKSQFPLCRTAAAALNFKIIENPGFEADDIIATLAKQVVEQQEKAIIISSDKDLMQLVNHDIVMYDSLKNKFITEKEVLDKFGVPPVQVKEVLAIMGDSSDNIPGINGIGPKGAAELIQKYGTLENVLANVDEITQSKRKEAIINCREQALISKKLVTLDENVPLNLTLDDLVHHIPLAEKLFPFLSKHGFNSIITKAEKLFNFNENFSLPIEKKIIKEIKATFIMDIELFKSLLQASELTGKLAIYFVAQDAEILGLSFTTDGVNNYYLKIDNSLHADLFNNNSSKITLELVCQELEKYLENNSILKIFYDLKNTLKIIASVNPKIQINAYTDIMLMHYAINTGNNSSDLYSIINEYLDSLDLSSLNEELQNNKVKLLNSLSVEAQAKHYSKICQALFELYPILKQELKKKNSLTIFKEIDMPISNILSVMEQKGIKIDAIMLQKLSSEFSTEINLLEEKIFKLAGQEFNIGSPKQLGEILFKTLGLPSKKVSAKSGDFSTGADILESLSEAGYEIADLILKWRQLSKLKNTYTDSLPKQINPLTGRIHTTFLQTSTNTGRFSSQDPNLQNIPIRTNLGEKIRSAFIASPNHMLISADYSQIELRLLSHMAKIETLQDAFKHNKDIHTETACQVFKLPAEQITSDIRRKAKAINFGIIYGISSFGLAKQLNISKYDAAKYIEEYFKEYPGIQRYMEEAKQFAREHGYVESLFGRKCYIKYINDKKSSLRAFSERAAINAPLQGTTADIAKVAMIKVDKLLKAEGLKTQMLLQVHDELLFEAPNDEVEIVMPLIKNTMQNVIKLSIPFIVDIKAGRNWSEL